jgi:hypothetical protein
MIFDSPSALANAIKYFDSRCTARAYLAHVGEIEFHDAVDELQAAAVSTGLVEATDQDWIQEFLAHYFKNVTNKPDPKNGQHMQPDTDDILPDHVRKIFADEHQKKSGNGDGGGIGDAHVRKDYDENKNFSWDDPDTSILDDRRGDLPEFPIEVLSSACGAWVERAATVAA